MGVQGGSITTDIIRNGLVFNMDAANRASYVPNATTSFNTINLFESGSLENGVEFAQPPLSASTWEFDGTDSYIEINQKPLGLNKAISVSSWCKTSKTVGYAVIVNESNWGTKLNWLLFIKSSYIEWVVYHDDTGTSKTTIEDHQTNSHNVADGNWHNIVGVWDGTTNLNSFKVFLDGAEIFQTSSMVTGINTEAASTTIGNASNQNSGYQPWDGAISSVQIYDRGLSAEEVLYNYNGLKSRFGL